MPQYSAASLLVRRRFIRNRSIGDGGKWEVRSFRRRGAALETSGPTSASTSEVISFGVTMTPPGSVNALIPFYDDLRFMRFQADHPTVDVAGAAMSHRVGAVGRGWSISLPTEPPHQKHNGGGRGDQGI
jgi:hypothetical protein